MEDPKKPFMESEVAKIIREKINGTRKILKDKISNIHIKGLLENIRTHQ